MAMLIYKKKYFDNLKINLWHNLR